MVTGKLPGKIDEIRGVTLRWTNISSRGGKDFFEVPLLKCNLPPKIISLGVYYLDWGVLFLFFSFETGRYCYSYESLNIPELKKGNCQQIKNATSQHWLKADCKIRSSREYQKRDFTQCLQLWCDYFSICLHQTTEWKNYCSLKFYRLRSSFFDISTREGGNDVSHFKHVYVKYCGIPKYGRNYFLKTFAIRITFIECQSRKTGKGLCLTCLLFEFMCIYHWFMFKIL